MIRRQLGAVVAAIFLAGAAAAAEREVIKADWGHFEQQVSARKLTGRSVRVRLSGGGEVKTNLLQVTDAGLVVRATRATQRWRSGENAQIPKDQVASVRFEGRMGHHGLIGALIGFGAGAGIGAAVAANSDLTEGPAVIILPVAGAAIAITGWVSGYYIGRSTGRLAPEFVLVP